MSHPPQDAHSSAPRYLTLLDLPPVPGLRFRLFQGKSDLPAIEEVRRQVRAVDGDIWLPGPDESNTTCDPLRDCVLVEVEQQVVGYSWLDWWTEANGTHLYLHLGWLIPAWRRHGIGRALLRWQEQRLREIANTHSAAGPNSFGGNADDSQPANRALLLSEGYTVAFTFVWMRCQLPSTPVEPTVLPRGLEIRPVTPEQFPAIYALVDQVFSASQFAYSSGGLENFLSELHWPQVDLNLWHVAWEGEQIVGVVISEITEAGDGHTLWVAVAQSWRQRGLGRALMTRTLRAMQERGASQAELGTVAENPGRSVHLYESVGYQVVRRHPRYRKPMTL